MGGLGFIGSHLSRLLLRSGHNVRIFDRLHGSRNLIADIETEVDVQEGDAEKPGDVLRSMKDIDVAVDLIHTTVPGASMDNSSYDISSNVVAHAKWLSRIGETELKRIIYVSSGGTVYGIPRTNPISEDHPTDPVSSYGITKLCIEKYVSMYSVMNNVEYRICRPANVYGEWQHLNLGQGAVGVFLKQCIECQPIEIWGDGTIQRDYVYVADLARAISSLIDHRGRSKIFNISSGIGLSLNEMIEIIRDKMGMPANVNYLPGRVFDVPVNVLDSSRLTNETGWVPQVDIVEGMQRVYTQLKSTK
jgi:UDP-glucose 4-epimerase